MRVAIVGAGAVGRCYASRLARGGAEVAFRVRSPTQATRVVVYDLRRGGFETHAFDAPVFTTDAEVAAWRPDVLLLTVPTDALRSGDWVAPLLAAAPHALVVALEPGVDDARLLREAAPGVRLAQGIIALIAYQAPLPGETRFPEPGVAVYAPLTCPFAGPPEVRPALEAFVAVLAAGGMRVEIRGDLDSDGAFGTLVMATWVTALRAAGWTFAGLSETGALAHRAVGQALPVVAAHTGLRAPRWPALLRPWLVRLGMRAAAAWMPLPLETYLRVHFTKVGAQTRMHVGEIVERGAARGMPVDAVRELLARADAAVPPKVPGP